MKNQNDLIEKWVIESLNKFKIEFERTILNHHRSRIFFENNTNATVTVCIIENWDDTLLGIRKMILDQSNNQLRKIDNSIHREKLKENSSSSSIYPKRRSKFLIV